MLRLNLVLFFLFIFNTSQSQVFIPFSYNQSLSNCTTSYCPTLTLVAATLQGTAGSTTVVNNVCTDDNFSTLTLPFEFAIAGANYKNYYVGSNGYITAGTGSTLYSGLGAAVPAFPKFMFGAEDRNYQYVYTKSGTNYFRTRVEGNNAYGTCSVNSIYELTFYRPTVNYLYVQVVFGVYAATSLQQQVASASAYYATQTITPNTSYVFWSYNGGKTWTILTGYSITGAGTTL